MTNSEQKTGSKIRSIRRKRGKSQRDIAELLHISVPGYSKIETGITDLNISRLCQIAALFEVSPCSLLPGMDLTEDWLQKEADYVKRLETLKREVAVLQDKLIKSYDRIDELTKTKG